MKFGVCIFLTHYAALPADTAHAAEHLGFESLWIPEHPCIPVEYETPFPGTGGKRPAPTGAHTTLSSRCRSQLRQHAP